MAPGQPQGSGKGSNRSENSIQRCNFSFLLTAQFSKSCKECARLFQEACNDNPTLIHVYGN